MASNYTTNYELPLWAADDAFLRTEFNDANQKIDAALEIATAERELAAYTTAGSYSLNIPLTELDLTPYRKIVLEGLLRYQSGGNSNLNLTFNQVKDEDAYEGVLSEGRIFAGNVHTTPTLVRMDLWLDQDFLYGSCSTAYATGTASNSSERFFFRVKPESVSRAQLTSIQLSSQAASIPFAAGMPLRLRGCKF